MPTAVIRYEIKEEIAGTEQYPVRVEVLDAQYIESAIFVFDVEHQAFIGVATPFDMITYPATREAAQEANLDYFRASGVLRTFDTISSATDFSTITASRIESLRRDWQTYLDNFESTVVITTPSES